MADNTTELEVLDEIVDVLGGQSGQYETVVPTLQQIRDLLGGGGGGGGYNPALSVGRADALTGADSTAQWATRESTGSGAATVRSVQGAAVVQDGELVPVRIAGMQSSGFNHFKLDGRTNVIFPSYPASDKRAMSESNLFQGITMNNIGGASTVSFSAVGNGYTVTSTSNGYGLGLPVPVSPSTAYHVQCNSTGSIGIGFYTADGTYIRYYGGSSNSVDFTTPDNCYWIMVVLRPAINTPTTYEDICVNVSGTRNGEYEPYRIVDSIEWPTQTLRAAGSVCDELTSDELVTRVGERNYQSGDESDATVRTDGTTTYYPLATPTTTPISPALPMTYRVQAGGSESIIVPDGEVSAAPVLTVADGESAADVVMDALACIATPDGPIATANHAANTYLTYNGKLYKVTSAIAVGESIVAGTNVSQTTVMAELIARTA